MITTRPPPRSTPPTTATQATLSTIPTLLVSPEIETESQTELLAFYLRLINFQDQVTVRDLLSLVHKSIY